jgi:hypothetical protein
VVEIRTEVPADVARGRYRARAAGRHPGHLDGVRDETELWGAPVAPLGVGPLVTVGTVGTVGVGDVAAVARAVREASEA